VGVCVNIILKAKYNVYMGERNKLV